MSGASTWGADAVPSRLVPGAGGTPIAVFSTGDGPPLVLVHGATADHTTFRVVGPRLAERFTLHAIDRRGRGASGDATDYSIEAEFDDVAAVAEAVAAEHGAPVPVVGHSFGGRCALGAARRTAAIAAVLCYEGGPPPPGRSYHPPGIEDRLAADLAAGDPARALARFMTEVVGMDEDALARFRADPVWPRRVAAAHTLLRELRVEPSPAASLDALGSVAQPVVLVLGGASRPIFRDSTDALLGRLPDAELVVIDGARHAAHHTHPDAFVAAVERLVQDRRADGPPRMGD